MTRRGGIEWHAPPGFRRIESYRAAIPRWLGRDDDRLVPFAPLLDRLLEDYGPRDTIAALDVVELGPGRRVRFAECMSEGDRAGRFRCVGLPEFASPLTPYAFEDVNAFLAKQPKRSIDLVVSRFVLEPGSFHPLALLRSSGWRKLAVRGKDPTVLRTIPGTDAYLETTADRLQRVLRPDGRIIAMVVDRRRCERWLGSEAVTRRFDVVERRAIGWRMGRFVLRHATERGTDESREGNAGGETKT